MKKMNPVVHFELPAEDRKRMSDFYSKVFGWQSQMLDETMGNYVIVTTSENDKYGRPKMPGTINGGFYPKIEDSSALYPSIVIAVESVNESIEEIINAGGNILNGPVEIPGFGMYVSFLDTEGNRISIIQPFME